jgi:FkbM family methyltransferase
MMLKNAWTVLTRPQMAAKYSAWLANKVTGRPCTISLPGGATISGFRRFSDYWTFIRPSPAELNLLRRVVRRNGVVADIGANIGGFTVTMAFLAPAGRVLAFEPAPTTFRILQENISQNRLASVEAHQVAVTDSPGQIQFTDDTICAARNRIATETAMVGDAPVVTVDAIRLDQFCAERAITRLDFVKTDTEGAETRVFRGASELLRNRCIGSLLVEVCPPALAEMGSNPREFLETVEGFGYAAFWLQPDGAAGERLGTADLERMTSANVLVQPQ